MSKQHASVTVLIVALTAPAVVGQGVTGVAGTWRKDASRSDTVMGPRGEAVSSALDLRPLLRAAAVAVPDQDLTIAEVSDTVDLQRPKNGRTDHLTLPLSGALITTVDANGLRVSAQATKEGGALVIRLTETVWLPGGATSLIDVVERYTLTTNNELVVDVTRATGSQSQRLRSVYTRVQ